MRVLIIPASGKVAKDPSGYLIPLEGRYYSYGPYWIRAKNRGLVTIQTEASKEKKEEIGQKPKKGYYNRGKGK